MSGAQDILVTAATVMAGLTPILIWGLTVLLNIRDRIARIEGYLWPARKLADHSHDD